MSRSGRNVAVRTSSTNETSRCGVCERCSGRKVLSMDTIRAVAMHHGHALDLKCKIAHTCMCAHALMSDSMLIYSEWKGVEAKRE